MINTPFKFLQVYTKMYESFYIKKFICFTWYNLNIFIKKEAKKEAIWIYNKLKNGSEILEYKYKGILLGDLIYDTYIRTLKNSYTVKKDENLLKFIKKSIKFLLIYQKIIDKYKVEYLVIGDKQYIEFGVLARVGVKNNLKVILAAGPRIKVLTNKNVMDDFFKADKGAKKLEEQFKNIDYEKEIDEYFVKCFNGEITQHDATAAYKNKKTYLRSEITNLLNMDVSKKNVFIMPHVFSDAPHTCGTMLYNDYYQWLNELLGMIQNIDNVNWIIKPHPSSYIYEEVGAVEKIISEKNINNVNIVPKDFSTASVVQCADVILTVRGTAALEFSCFGIPSVLAGDATFSGYGFTTEPKSIEEYKNILENLDKFKELNDEQKKMAKLLMYWRFKGSFIDKEFPSRIVLPSDIKEPKDRIVFSDRNFEELIEVLKVKNPKEKEYYKYVISLELRE